MAALDFPSAPTDGQYFTASNKVVYQWQATPGVWVAIGNVGAMADLYSTGNGAQIAPPSINTWFTSIFPTVITGNSGGWYNTSNGRLIPPPGRYRISASATFNSSSAAVLGQIKARKNGIDIITGASPPAVSSAGANQYATAAVEVEVDANGTDFFEIQTQTTVLWSNAWGWFMVIPVFSTQGPAIPATPVGDFFASGTQAIGAANTVLLPPVLSGNSGSWYNPANGRYTPPPGRYYVWATITTGGTSAASAVNCWLRKNGVTFGPVGGQVPGGAGWYGDPQASIIVDMNGTDYIDALGFNSAGAPIASWQYTAFGAFPLGGAVGPQGPPGLAPAGDYWRKLKRVVPTAGQTVIDFTASDIPSDINDLKFHFDVSPTTADHDLVIQFFDTSGALINTSYASMMTYGAHTSNGSSPVSYGSGGTTITSAIALSSGVATRRVSNLAGTGGIRGRAEIENIRDASRIKGINWQEIYLSGDNTLWLIAYGSAVRSLATAISGFRLSWFQGSTFQAGGEITLWGSP